jgi:hypothetical protein
MGANRIGGAAEIVFVIFIVVPVKTCTSLHKTVVSHTRAKLVPSNTYAAIVTK